MAKSGFGVGKSIPNQGGVAKPNVAPSRVTAQKPGGAPTGSTPGLGPGHATNPIVHTPGKGGSMSKNGAGGPKPFKG